MNKSSVRQLRDVVTALLLLAGSITVAAEPRVISRDLCSGLWMVPLEWASKSGAVHRLDAVFDTGGSGLFIDPDSLERLSGRRIAPGTRVRMEGVSAAGLEFSKFRPEVREMDHLAVALGRGYDVFLPFFAFRDFLLVLDYPAREMRLERGELPQPDGTTLFSARGTDRRPWIEVDLGATTRRLLIDSGSNGRIALRDLYGLSWQTPPLPLKVSATFRGDRHNPIGRIADTIEVANLVFHQPIVSITDDTELIGAEILKHFKVTFDQKNRRVRFEPGASGPVRMAPERGTGAVFRADPAGFFETVRVLPDTPAERAGINVGDRIVRFNGEPVPARGCRALDEPSRDSMVLGVSRGGAVDQITVPVVDLIE